MQNSTAAFSRKGSRAPYRFGSGVSIIGRSVQTRVRGEPTPVSAGARPLSPARGWGMMSAMPVLPYLAPAALSLLILSSCVGPAVQPQAAPRPQSRPQPAPPRPAPAVPAPTPSADWSDGPVAPGNWTYAADSATPAASYGVAGGRPLLVIRCEMAAKRLVFVRAGAGQGVMTVRTSYGAQAWPATSVATPSPEIRAVRAASDPVLDQIAYSRGKFAVEAAGLAPLILPVWAQVSRVVEDCRS